MQIAGVDEYKTCQKGLKLFYFNSENDTCKYSLKVSVKSLRHTANCLGNQAQSAYAKSFANHLEYIECLLPATSSVSELGTQLLLFRKWKSQLFGFLKDLFHSLKIQTNNRGKES